MAIPVDGRHVNRRRSQRAINLTGFEKSMEHPNTLPPQRVNYCAVGQL